MPESAKKEVTIYTDGACSGNPGPGGWGAVLIYGAHRRELSGGDAHTTNNRMELTGPIAALELLNQPWPRQALLGQRIPRQRLQPALAGFMAAQWLAELAEKTRRKSRAMAAPAGAVPHARCDIHKGQGPRRQSRNNRCDELARAAIAARRA